MIGAPPKIVLYQGPRMWGSVNMSPFCCKVETWLRLAELPYEVAPFIRGDAPKGKMPYVDIDGERVADSAFILDRLRALCGDPVDAHLSAGERALGHAVARMLEEGTYFVGLFLRWGTEEGFSRVKEPLGRMMPAVARPVGIPLVRRKVLQGAYAQGVGRHTLEEIVALGERDLTALSELLGGRAYLLGERPSSYDATVFAFMQSLLNVPFDSPIKAFGEALPNLRPYERRMAERCFPEGMDALPGARRP